MAFGHYRLDEDALESGQLFHGVDVANSQVIGRDVQDDADFALIEAEARSQNSASSRFQHRYFHRWVGQNQLSTLRPGIVSGFYQIIADVSAIGSRVASNLTCLLDNVRKQASGCSFAVGSGYR